MNREKVGFEKVKVSDYYPIFYAENVESETRRFTEVLGFAVKHRPKIEFLDYVVLENEKKRRVDIVHSRFPADSFKEGFLGMRVNVDDFDEAYILLEERGFRNCMGEGNLIVSPYIKGAHMASPSGFEVMLMQHLKG